MKLPESWLLKSEKQIELEQQGHIFNGQELLDNHEIDHSRPCYCGRPILTNKGNEDVTVRD